MGYIGVISYNPLILTIDPNFQRDIQVDDSWASQLPPPAWIYLILWVWKRPEQVISNFIFFMIWIWFGYDSHICFFLWFFYDLDLGYDLFMILLWFGPFLLVQPSKTWWKSWICIGLVPNYSNYYTKFKKHTGIFYFDGPSPSKCWKKSRKTIDFHWDFHPKLC